MDTIDEVFQSMSQEDAIDVRTNIEYLIDNELRIITVPKNGVVLGVEGDKDVNAVHFKMSRMYRGLDLGDGFNIRVNYANAKAELGYFAVVRPDVTEDSISFEWLLGSHALMYVGEIKFAVSLIKSSVDGRIEKKFNTTLGKAKCLTGLDVDVSVPEEDIYDLLTQIKQDVMADIQPSLDGAKADAAAAKQSATQAAESAATASTGAENVRLGVEAVKDAVKIAEQTSAHVDEVKTAVEASATAASSDAAKAEEAKTAAVTAQGKAETAKTSAEQFKMAAEQAKTEASTSKTAAAESAKQAKASQDAASTSAQTASTKAEEAKTSADAAKVSETNAKASENAATSIVENAKIVSDNVLKGEKTATLINVTDAWPSKLRGMKIYGQSNQITTTGKNLMRLINSGIANGVDLTANGDGSYHVKGTQTAGFTRFYTDDGIKKPLAEFGLKVGDTVYLSAAEASTKLYVALFFFDEKGSGVYTQVTTSANVTKYTIPENVTQAYACISLDGNVGTSVDSDFHPMISLINNKDWEPYTGGRPSPSPEYPQEITNLNKAELVITGRNLVEQSTTSTNALNQFSSCLFVEADLMPSTNYVLSFNDVVGNGYYINEVLFSNFHDFTTKSGRNVVKLSTKAEISKANTGQYGKQGWIILKNNKNQDKAPAFTDVQIELGDTETAYEPHKSKSTPIDLQGNELCSLPNGVKDEVVIDAEGNVSLIKRLWKFQKRIGDMNNSEAYPGWKFTDNELKENIGAGIDVSINGISSHFQRFSANTLSAYDGGTLYISQMKQSELIAKYPDVIVSFIVPKVKPQTIPLGKVELPALPEATSNVWNDGNIPANVYINYLKDVNIAYSDLENQIKQITTALSVTTLEIATK